VSVVKHSAVKAPVGATRNLRHESQVRVSITSATSGITLSTGVLIEAGEQTVDIPESEYEALSRHVRDAGLWAVAEKRYAKDLAKWLGEGNSEKSCPYSVEASYYTVHGEAPGWILALDIIETDLPPELTEEDRRLAAIHKRSTSEAKPKKG
jgi:hypothetical protein